MNIDDNARWLETRRPTVITKQGAVDVSRCAGRALQRQIRSRSHGVCRRPRRRRVLGARNDGMLGFLLMLLLLVLVSPVHSALLNFENCLDASVIESSPAQLQFVPLNVSVTFDLDDPLNPLNVTVYGNVSGTADRSSSYPSPSDPQWSNPNETVGKIVDLNAANNKWTTLLTNVDVVSFSPYSDASRFCDSVPHKCPLTPVFFGNA